MDTSSAGPVQATVDVQYDEKERMCMRHPILQFFTYSHLPEKLQKVSQPFCDLAYSVAQLPHNAESATALRKLLEAKDAAVRAVLFKM